ncbi:GNAT family N-acetyltransferase [uncultured Methylobacterium sp.]|uniref:GNAT family N-acetyltransferase n=1 Tax=uncultured Methylobacterium sp. TaxID=157278 RepID=UPI0035CA1815
MVEVRRSGGAATDDGASRPEGGRVTVRAARLDDLDALVALEHATFATDRAERRAIRHAIRSATMSVLVMLLDEGEGACVLVGAATLERRRNSRGARLSSIAVSSARAGLGLGGRLMEAVEAEARRHGCTRLTLEVRADNGAGLRLYERRGYTRFSVREGYYEDGMEAWCYERALDGASPSRSRA